MTTTDDTAVSFEDVVQAVHIAIGAGSMVVNSFSRGSDKNHRVRIVTHAVGVAEAVACTCEDYLYRGNVSCKHVRAVNALLVAASVIQMETRQHWER